MDSCGRDGESIAARLWAVFVKTRILFTCCIVHQHPRLIRSN